MERIVSQTKVMTAQETSISCVVFSLHTHTHTGTISPVKTLFLTKGYMIWLDQISKNTYWESVEQGTHLCPGSVPFGSVVCGLVAPRVQTLNLTQLRTARPVPFSIAVWVCGWVSEGLMQSDFSMCTLFTAVLICTVKVFCKSQGLEVIVVV